MRSRHLPSPERRPLLPGPFSIAKHPWCSIVTDCLPWRCRVKGNISVLHYTEPLNTPILPPHVICPAQRGAIHPFDCLRRLGVVGLVRGCNRAHRRVISVGLWNGCRQVGYIPWRFSCTGERGTADVATGIYSLTGCLSSPF